MPVLSEEGLKNGLAFLPKGKLTITSRQILVPISMHITEILTPPEELEYRARTLLQEVHQNYKTIPHFNLLSENLRAIEKGINDQERKLRDYITQFRDPVKSRKRRGWVNGIGEIGRTLFGIATEQQVTRRLYINI